MSHQIRRFLFALLIIMAALIPISVHAATFDVTVTETGTLEQVLTSQPGYVQEEVTAVTISTAPGAFLNYQDFMFLRASLPNMTYLNIEQADCLNDFDPGAVVEHEIPRSAMNGNTTLRTIVLSKKVTSIGYGAFTGCTGLRGDLVIPDNVTKLSRLAFGFYGDHFAQFTSLTLGKNLKTIEAGAFLRCKIDGGLAIPASVELIDGNWDQGGAFQACQFSGDITIEEGSRLKKIGAYAFSSCPGLTGQLALPEGLETLAGNSFSGCKGLTGTLIIPSTLKSVGGAFTSCSGLEELIISEGVEVIGDSAFNGCSGLSGDLVIPDSVTTIGGSAFYNCGFDGQLTLGNSVKTIGSSAFRGPRFIGDLTIPDSVESIGDSAFYGCAFDGTLTVGAGVRTIGSSAFTSSPKYTGYVMRSRVLQSIGGSAFASNAAMAGDISLPDSLETIGASAFSGCGQLTGNLNLSGVSDTLGASAFLNCSGLSGELTIPIGVTEIGNSAFQGCVGFDGELTLSPHLTAIGASAFSGCAALSGSVSLPGATSVGNNAFDGCSGLNGTLSASPQLRSVGQFAFRNCGALRGDVGWMEDLETIGNSAFQNCAGLTGDLNLRNAASIGSSAFEGCAGLNGALSLGENLTSIGASAFRNCSQLSGPLTIPGGVTGMGASAFQYCTGLSGTLTINGSGAIGNNMFDGCTGLDELILGENVTGIGNYAFQNCTDLSGNLNLPSNLTTLGASAFYGCAGLGGNIVLPNSLTTLGNYVFRDTGITSLSYHGSSIASITNNQLYTLPAIRTLDLSGSAVTALEWTSAAANLNEVKLPGGLATLKLTNKQSLEDLDLSACTSLTSVDVSSNALDLTAGDLRDWLINFGGSKTFTGQIIGFTVARGAQERLLAQNEPYTDDYQIVTKVQGTNLTYDNWDLLKINGTHWETTSNLPSACPISRTPNYTVGVSTANSGYQQITYYTTNAKFQDLNYNVALTVGEPGGLIGEAKIVIQTNTGGSINLTNGLTKTYGDVPFALRVQLTNIVGTVEWKTYGDASAAVESSDVVEIDQDGMVTIKGAGTGYVQASIGDTKSAAVKVTVNKKALTVTSATGKSKQYGNADAANYGQTLPAGVYGATATDLGLYYNREPGEDVGVYKVWLYDGPAADETDAAYVAACKIKFGAENPNYELTYNYSADNSVYTITRRPVAITTAANKSKTYGAADAANFGQSIPSGINGEVPDVWYKRDEGEDIGVYNVHLYDIRRAGYASDADYIGACVQRFEELNPNYTLSYTYTAANSVYTINPKALALGTLNLNAKTYDGTLVGTPSSLAPVTGAVAGDVLVQQVTATYDDPNVKYDGGVVVAQDGTVVVKVTGEKIHNYAVPADTDTVFWTVEKDAENKNIVSITVTKRLAGKTLTNKINPIALTISVKPANKVYDGTTQTTIEADRFIGLIPSDKENAGSIKASFLDKNVGNEKPVILISEGDAIILSNYTIPDLSASITPAPLAVSGIASQDKEYDGTTAAVLIGTPAIDVSNRIEGDDVQIAPYGALQGSFYDKNVGVKKSVKVGTGFGLSGADAGNYFLKPTEPVLASITPATLTIKPDAGQYKSVNDIDPVFTYAVEGLKGEDAASMRTGTKLGREPGEAVGTYAYTLGSLAYGGNNYNLVLNAGGVTFAIRNTDATLKSLSTSAGTLTPAFDPDATSYVVKLTKDATSAPTLSAKVNDGAARMDIVQAGSLSEAATITVTAEDGETTRTYTVSFSVAEQVRVTAIAVDASAPGVNDGMIIASASGGSGLYQYKLSGGNWQNGNSFPSLAPGAYMVSVRDALDENNTATTGTETIVSTRTSPIGVAAPTNLKYDGGTVMAYSGLSLSGTLSASVAGGANPVYAVTGGDASISGDVLIVHSPGPVTVSARAVKNGEYSAAKTLTIPFTRASAVGISASKTDVSAYGGSNGAVTVTGSGGMGTYQYRINGGAWGASNTFTGLKPGVYTVYARDTGDTANVSEAREVTVTEPGPSDYYCVTAAYAWLSLGDTSAVKSALVLPAEYGVADRKIAIVWASSDTRYLDNNGNVNRPSYWEGDQTVTVTATITCGSVTRTKTFSVTIVKTPPPAEVAQHRIIATAGEHGAISPAGEIMVESGGSQKFTFVPDEGYAADVLLLDGGEINVSGMSGYTLTDIRSAHTVHVTFAENPRVVIEPSTLTLAVGETYPLTAYVAPEGRANRALVWSSSNESVSTVRNDGLVTAVAEGSAVITASTEDGGLSATCEITVRSGAGLDTIETVVNVYDMVVGSTKTLPVFRNAKVAWRVEDESVAKLSTDGKRIKALQRGETALLLEVLQTLSGKGLTMEGHYLEAGRVYRIELHVLKKNQVPTKLSVAQKTLKLDVINNRTAQIVAKVKPADAVDAEVFYETRNPAIATVDHDGLVTAVAPGQTKVYVYAANLKRVAVTVKVKGLVTSLRILDDNGKARAKHTMSVGAAEQLQVKVNSSALNKAVSWASSNEKVAIVDENGLIRALQNGTAIITATATDGSGKKATLKLKVKN